MFVVTDDPAAREAMAAAGAWVLPDEPNAGLNPALAHGAAGRAVAPRDGVALLSADLPALRPAELDAALAAAAGHDAAFVADAAAPGPRCWPPARRPVTPRYGQGSAAAHRAAGAVELTGDWPSLRNDVDTAADLRTAAELGPRPGHLGLDRHPRRRLSRGGPEPGAVQATVATFDPGPGAGPC